MYSKLHEKYGDSPDPRIRKRTDLELRLMEMYHLADQLRAVYDLSVDLKEKHIPYAMGGESGNSLILYLLGITETNPLPAHYYDPDRKTVEFAADLGRTEQRYRTLLKIRDGYDLPERGFDHEGTWDSDGHDLSPELFWGNEPVEMGRTTSPQISMRVPVKAFGDVKRFLKEKPALVNAGRSESDGIGFYCGCLHVISSIILPDQSDTWFQPMDSSRIRDYCVSHFQSILKLDNGNVKPQTFLGVLKMYGLSRGSWSNILNQKSVTLESGEDDTVYTLKDFAYSLDVVPAFYDEVMETLIGEGMDRSQAYEEAERVHHGRGLTGGLTQVYYENNRLPWCNYAIHLFPKAHGIEYMIMCWRIERDRMAKAQKEAEKQLEQDRIAGKEMTKHEMGHQETIEIKADEAWKLRDADPRAHAREREAAEGRKSAVTADTLQRGRTGAVRPAEQHEDSPEGISGPDAGAGAES